MQDLNSSVTFNHSVWTHSTVLYWTQDEKFVSICAHLSSCHMDILLFKLVFILFMYCV